MARSKTPLIFFAVVVVLSIVAVILVVNKCSSDQPGATGNAGVASDTDQPGKGNNTEAGQGNDPDGMTLTPDGKHVDDVSTAQAGTPEELVGRISEVTVRANNTGDAQPLIQALGQQRLTPDQANKLRQLAAASRLKLDESKPFSSVQDAANRWALNLADRNRIFLDLSKTADGKWQVNKITLPGGKLAIDDNSDPRWDPANPNQEKQAAATVHGFIDAIIKLDPASARQHIDPTKVSYARLAGLCIIFEEGKYTLLKERAVRKMFLRNTTAGWLARVEAQGSGESAMFAINTKRKDANAPWKITEINLDQLLADYANRVSGGDIYYTPLIKNPKGGDSLVIYFDLDSNNLTLRTQRQLTIVANLLKADKTKKLTISGHTDALGSDDYNLQLSKMRAKQVMVFLTENGVDPSQMKVVGYGKSKPRLPNTTEDGHDAPDHRRANRRAEIFLDF
ncbi:MAG: OmpA family protein [Verrucomicrobiae bacterium]|nr:OmpA family protein [Verrucomicrobiae bacterium]NNJ87033.1 OmpA family protein [Akkermansiaceae bacterium]